jgi:hypothetical protein
MAGTTLPGPTPEDIYGKWVGLAKNAAKFGLAANAVPGGAAAVDLLASLVGLGDTKVALLKSIKNDTKLVREQSFRTTRTLLEEAERVGSRDPRYAGWIDDALKEFYKASAGKEGDARHWFSRSRLSARAAVNDLTRNGAFLYVRDERPSTPRNLRATLMKYVQTRGMILKECYPVVGTVVFYKPLQRAKAAAADLVSFANMVESVTASAFNEEKSVPLELVEDRTGVMVLREVSPG